MASSPKFDVKTCASTRWRHLRSDALLLAGFCGFLFFFGLSLLWIARGGRTSLCAGSAGNARPARLDHSYSRWQPWLEKPVLYYWQTMLAYRIFGVSDWAARLASAVDAALMVVAVYLFLRRFRSISKSAGFQFTGFSLDGALTTASASGVVGFARAASTDMPLAAMFTIAMLAWFAWHARGEAISRVVLIFLGFATLAKGPVAPFFALVMVVIFVAGKSGYRAITRTLWLPGIRLILSGHPCRGLLRFS